MQEIRASLKPLVCSNSVQLFIFRPSSNRTVDIAKLRPIEFKEHDMSKIPSEDDALQIEIPDILYFYKSLGEELEKYGLVKPHEGTAVNIELRNQIASLKKIIDNLTTSIGSIQPVVNTFIDREITK